MTAVCFPLLVTVEVVVEYFTRLCSSPMRDRTEGACGRLLAFQNIWNLYFCFFFHSSFYLLLVRWEDILDNGGGKRYPL